MSAMVAGFAAITNGVYGVWCYSINLHRKGTNYAKKNLHVKSCCALDGFAIRVGRLEMIL